MIYKKNMTSYRHVALYDLWASTDTIDVAAAGDYNDFYQQKCLLTITNCYN